MEIVEPDETTTSAFSLFQQRLIRKWTRKGTPHGFGDALRKAKVASEESTDRIFIDIGFSAWIAYYFLSKDLRKNHRGQRAERITLDAFDQLPASQRRMVAMQLLQVQAHETVTAAIS